MPVPKPVVKYVDKTPVERMADSIAKTLENEVKQSQLNQISVAAQVYDGIEKYRSGASSMTYDQLESEPHVSSRLRMHLIEKFGFEPRNCHAHAMVAGRHPLAATLRSRMALLQIRIDDVDNGCWLAENTAATPHPQFPKAPPHSRIHRYNYYWWLSSRLALVEEEKAFRNRIKLIISQLITGNFPDYVMMPKGVDLPGAMI